MSAAYDVSAIGLYIVDVLGRPIDAFPDRSVGHIAFIDELRFTVAGTAGGTVVDCAKLGLRARAVGAVGGDEKADFLLHTLAGFGIDTTAMQRYPSRPTSSTILTIRSNGERPAFHQRGASDDLLITADMYDEVCDARFVHLGGTGLLAAMDGLPTVNLLRAAKERGRTTTFDLLGAKSQTLELVRPALPYIDYFIPSIEEATLMSGLKDRDEIASMFLDAGAGTCILTMGGEGSYIASRDARFALPAFAIDVVDTTGCGDAYTAGFIAGLKLDWDLERSARLATAASALVATGLGSDAGIESLERTIEFMERTAIAGALH